VQASRRAKLLQRKMGILFFFSIPFGLNFNTLQIHTLSRQHIKVTEVNGNVANSKQY